MACRLTDIEFRTGQNCRAERRGYLHQFVQSDAPAIPGEFAELTTLALAQQALLAFLN